MDRPARYYSKHGISAEDNTARHWILTRVLDMTTLGVNPEYRLWSFFMTRFYGGNSSVRLSWEKRIITIRERCLSVLLWWVLLALSQKI